jgi:hypothetical protein
VNKSLDRGLLAQAIIIVALCVGSWVLLVQPKTKELRSLEATIAENAPDQSTVNLPTLEAAVSRMRAVKDRIALIQRSNTLATDSSALYGQIMSLASQYEVTVQNLQPGGLRQPSADNSVSINRIELSAEGTYQNTAKFLEAIDQIEGFIRPVSLAVVPQKETANSRVVVRFGCEALSFKLSDALLALGGDHVSP